MRTLSTLSLLATLLLSVPGFAAESQTTTPASQPTAIATRSATFKGQVVTVDLKQRVVTLRAEDGETFQVAAGDDAWNLQELRAGDRVTAQATRTVVMQLAAVKSEPQTFVEGMVSRVPQGMKPGAMFEREVQFTADVLAVDPGASTITLKGAADNLAILSVNDPAILARIKAGDQVEGLLAQSLEISVAADPAKSKAKTKK